MLRFSVNCRLSKWLTLDCLRLSCSQFEIWYWNKEKLAACKELIFKPFCHTPTVLFVATLKTLCNVSHSSPTIEYSVLESLKLSIKLCLPVLLYYTIDNMLTSIQITKRENNKHIRTNTHKKVTLHNTPPPP